jgi:hypothetical protein
MRFTCVGYPVANAHGGAATDDDIPFLGRGQKREDVEFPKAAYKLAPATLSVYPTGLSLYL